MRCSRHVITRGDPDALDGYSSRLAWEHSGVPLDELEKVAGEREVWEFLFRLLPHDLAQDKQKKMDGWLCLTSRVGHLLIRRLLVRAILGQDSESLVSPYAFIRV